MLRPRGECCGDGHVIVGGARGQPTPDELIEAIERRRPLAADKACLCGSGVASCSRLERSEVHTRQQGEGLLPPARGSTRGQSRVVAGPVGLLCAARHPLVEESEGGLPFTSSGAHRHGGGQMVRVDGDAARTHVPNCRGRLLPCAPLAARLEHGLVVESSPLLLLLRSHCRAGRRHLAVSHRGGLGEDGEVTVARARAKGLEDAHSHPGLLERERAVERAQQLDELAQHRLEEGESA